MQITTVKTVVSLLCTGALVASAAFGEDSNSIEKACLMQQYDSPAASGEPVIEWWYMREGDTVETRKSDGEFGERWLVNPISGELSYQFIDHGEKAIVDFSAQDLEMMGVHREDMWQWLWPLPDVFETSMANQRVWIRPTGCTDLAKADVVMSTTTTLAPYFQFDYIDVGDMEYSEKVTTVLERMGVEKHEH